MPGLTGFIGACLLSGYVWLALGLLHASMLLRVDGDLAQSSSVRAESSAANAIALAAFAVSTITAVVRGRIAAARRGLPGGRR